MALTREKSKCQNCLKILKDKLMILLTLLGILLGFIVGFTVRLTRPSADTLVWIGMPGEVFLSLLKMPIIPLIISSVITASATMDPRKNGKLGILFLLLHIGTNFFGTGMGLMLGLSIKPGKSLNASAEVTETASVMQPQDIALDMVRNLFPSNVVRATLQKAVTSYTKMDNAIQGTINNISEVEYFEKTVSYVDSTNILGLLFCCVVFGLAAGQLKENGKPFLDFFHSANEVIMIVLQWFLWIAPIGILSLIAASIAAIDNILDIMIKLGLFVLCVVTGLAIHQLIVMPLIYWLATRKNPFKILYLNLKAWFMAFASASSAGAMPYLYETCNHLHIDERVTSFGVPMAVVLNATGSSLFISCAIVFLAQVNNMVLNIGQITTLFFMTSLSTMALPAAPSASIVLIVILCTTFMIPVESIGLLFAVEWFLDRIRTTSNVVSEIFILVLTWHWLKSDFNSPTTADIQHMEEVVIDKEEKVVLGHLNSSSRDRDSVKICGKDRLDDMNNVVTDSLLSQVYDSADGTVRKKLY